MTPDEVAAVLESSGGAFMSTLNSIPSALASWHPAKGEWCVSECAGHVIEADKRGFAGRIRIILGADVPDLPGWDRALTPAATAPRLPMSSRASCPKPEPKAWP